MAIGQVAGAAAIRGRCVDVLGGSPTIVAIDINGAFLEQHTACIARIIAVELARLRTHFVGAE